ncbi:hypothetical protein [Euzebya tangerina]|uniref:hypothetical protein n=1 Tax=Euzebya tangerina TaxID=591198 RepID=UPI000E31C604|nr:hypothetical protein [Euzebya tangerina]
MSDPTAQPTQEEIEAYYAQLREAPLHELLVQAIGMLATGAEAKLGRPDARILIDSMGALVQIGAGKLGEAEGQLQTAVAQLQMAQVQVEQQMAKEGASSEGDDGSADPSSAAASADRTTDSSTTPPASPLQQPSSPPAAEKKQTDKLWIPGRDG